ncbi:MAG: hypothetical protein DRN08_01510 [Thermoplasmata archaeon]|nr:MAG: hypothetical protein DRN05_05300 [Thermoplasmata archaeon]RLF36348.1 MAG: hypothetical protein DRN08_01510 [Thermoplasmata archaeon]
MEEVLYNIEIHKDEGKYLGRIYSDIDGVKEFRNERIYDLLRDITFDIQLALEEFANRTADFNEGHEEEVK